MLFLDRLTRRNRRTLPVLVLAILMGVFSTSYAGLSLLDHPTQGVAATARQQPRAETHEHGDAGSERSVDEVYAAKTRGAAYTRGPGGGASSAAQGLVDPALWAPQASDTPAVAAARKRLHRLAKRLPQVQLRVRKARTAVTTATTRLRTLRLSPVDAPTVPAPPVGVTKGQDDADTRDTGGPATGASSARVLPEGQATEPASADASSEAAPAPTAAGRPSDPSSPGRPDRSKTADQAGRADTPGAKDRAQRLQVAQPAPVGLLARAAALGKRIATEHGQARRAAAVSHQRAVRRHQAAVRGAKADLRVSNQRLRTASKERTRLVGQIRSLSTMLRANTTAAQLLHAGTAQARNNLSRFTGKRVSFPLPADSGFVDNHNWGGSGSMWSSWHTGNDFSVGCGTPVYAATAGTIELDTSQGWAGPWLVKVSTGPGKLTTWYAHMQAIRVSDGQRVDAGQQIGLVGSQGNSSGCHLHFELHPLGGSIYQDSTDPDPWLKATGAYPGYSLDLDALHHLGVSSRPMVYAPPTSSYTKAPSKAKHKVKRPKPGKSSTGPLPTPGKADDPKDGGSPKPKPRPSPTPRLPRPSATPPSQAPSPSLPALPTVPSKSSNDSSKGLLGGLLGK